VTPANSLARLSRQDMEVILAVTRALAAPYDLPSLLVEVTAAARRVLHAERCSVWLRDEATGELVLEVSADLPPVRIRRGFGLAGACALHGQLINVPDCYADPRFDPSVDKRSGFHTRCSLTLPLIDHQGRLIGVIQILNKHRGVFDAADEALAEALAAQCAVALSRARMTAALLAAVALRREAELAQKVQRAALPQRLPQVAGYDMHASFMPASLTGGDTYDLLAVEQGLLVVLGDAAGHGLAPALAVMQMQAMLRMALRLGATLETAFVQVNDQLVQTLPEGLFVTAFVGLLDATRHRLRFLSGGQGPILHFQAATGACAAYRATSFPLGAMPITALRPAVEFEMAPGDILVLLTDGIFEYEGPDGQMYGRQRVEQLVREHRHLPAVMLAEHLLADLRQFAEELPQEDDITIVLLKREPAAA
jgi:sigma-B regulation protein RsbU (phosphoserine phosphatase)